MIGVEQKATAGCPKMLIYWMLIYLTNTDSALGPNTARSSLVLLSYDISSLL